MQDYYTADNIALALQDLLICLEMPIFSVLHAYAFPWTDYDDARLSSRVPILYAIRDALGVKDIIRDTYLTFTQTANYGTTDDIWNDDDGESNQLLHQECSLEFNDLDQDDELLFEASRQLEFGDFNYPVLQEDPRFAHPPAVRDRIRTHAEAFNNRIRSESLEFFRNVASSPARESP
jgi:hypothetical protein